jgi:ferritin-like metal-binding protein YciE
MQLDSMQTLMVMTLQELHDAERQMLDAADPIAKATDDRALKVAMRRHIVQSRKHVKRIEQVLGKYGHRPGNGGGGGGAGRAKLHDEAMEGLIAEAKKKAKMTGKPEVKAVAVTAAQQDIEHHEIACYGSLVTWARQLGDDESADLLAKTLDEEEKFDRALSELAERRINPEGISASPDA